MVAVIGRSLSMRITVVRAAQILGLLCVIGMAIAQYYINRWSDAKSRAEHSHRVFSSIIEAHKLVDDATFLLEIANTCKDDRLRERLNAVEKALSSKIGDWPLKEPDKYYLDDSMDWEQLHKLSTPLLNALKESKSDQSEARKNSTEQLENVMIKIMNTHYELMTSNDGAAIKSSLNWMTSLLIVGTMQVSLVVLLLLKFGTNKKEP
jgi:hypothetical protein